MKEFAKEFYKSKRWQSCRTSYIDKRLLIDGGICEMCGEQPGYIVHHKVKLTPGNINDPQISLNHDLLEFVCKNCHDKEHFEDIHGKKANKSKVEFDLDGEPIPPIR